ncbi:hypothetical protein AQUCO_01000465v1 [Aquilegia coerulea]|uniref:non-specific serine/threonine protein kinase n=1 Tax=Aquilegia coerulea TaxID=218851 RepID=A0A2G5EA07_AQUCA|nr:hypothetical protein AQUCO_01000465v1 [Aquilegia coerulea]
MVSKGCWSMNLFPTKRWISTSMFLVAVNGGITLNWSRRLVIATGTAKGLAYLHEDCHPRIIHRDIKASNILLDNNYEAMVCASPLVDYSSYSFVIWIRKVYYIGYAI